MSLLDGAVLTKMNAAQPVRNINRCSGFLTLLRVTTNIELVCRSMVLARESYLFK